MQQFQMSYLVKSQQFCQQKQIITQRIHRLMKSQSVSDYLISIAEHILEESCPKQAFTKYKRVKATLFPKEQKFNCKSPQKLSFTLKESHRKSSKQRNSLLSETKLLKKQVGSGSLRNIKFQQSNLKGDITEKPTEKIRKRSVTFIVGDKQNVDSKDRKSTQKKGFQKKSPERERRLSKRQSQIKRPQSALQQSNMLTNLKLSESSKKSTSRDTLQPDNLVARKLFGGVAQGKAFVDNQISFNLQLNKMLQMVEKIVEVEKLKKENRQRQSTLSSENLRMLRKIGKVIGVNSQSNHCQDFKKKKYQQPQMNLIQAPCPNCNNQPSNCNSQSKETENIFDTIKLSSPNPNNNSILKLQKDDHQLGSAKTVQNDISFGDQFKRLKEEYRQKQKQLKSRFKSLQKDKTWLAETMEKLLNQNQQLKALILNQRFSG